MKTVNKSVVARYYLECELDNIVSGNNVKLSESSYPNTDVRLLEALSFTYRANDVFDIIEDGNYSWDERTVAVDDIAMTGMSEALTKVIYSQKVQQNPRKLAEFIAVNNGNKQFKDVAPRLVPTNRQVILLHQDGNTLKMLDGSHRLISMVMQGKTEVLAYVATLSPTGEKPMIGDATFLRLRKVWQQTDDAALKNAIEQTAAGMITMTSNGRESVEKYWLRAAPNEEVRTAGRRLLNSIA